MKRILTTLLFTCFLLNINLLKAQDNEVCGFVKHYFDKTPVEGAKVFIENSVVIAETDEAGAFCINLTEKENKIIIEKEGYFKTYVIANAKDFFSIHMIKQYELDIALAKGLTKKNIEDLNSGSVHFVSNQVKGSRAESSAYSVDGKKVSLGSKERLMSAKTVKRGATLSTSSSDVSRKSSATRSPGPAGAPGATGFKAAKAIGAPKASPPSAEFEIAEMIRSEPGEKRVAKKEKRSFVDDMDIIDEASTTKKEIKAGRLTAGEIHDFSKWELWNDLSENELSKYKDIWSLYPKERYAVQAVTEQGFPIVNATVTLNIDGEMVWSAKTDNTGKAELWNILFESQPASKKENAKLKALVNYKGVENSLQQLKRFEAGVNVITFKQNCDYAKNVDIAFVVDATGSMGDEIDYLKVELLDVIDRIQNEFTDLHIRLGNVFYRDKTDAYLTKNSPLTQNIKAGVAFIKDQKAGGGGDFPEAVDVGLEEAVNQLNWSNEALARIIFLVLDAPPHQNEEVNKKLKQTISSAAQQGIRIVPIVGSGIDKSTEYLLRSCALATNGHYVFLTDHSGIGGTHLKPSTDNYDVKNLNDLLVDIIKRYVEVPDCNAKEDPDEIEPQPNADLKILPNPNDGRFLIQSTADLNELFITDANGKILIRFTDFVTGENQVDISNFPTGTYFARYEQDGKIVTQKIVMKR